MSASLVSQWTSAGKRKAVRKVGEVPSTTESNASARSVSLGVRMAAALASSLCSTIAREPWDDRCSVCIQAQPH